MTLGITRTGRRNGCSFAQELKTVVSKFQRIVKRKAFLERRIHRYLHLHAPFLLPAFQKCYFEHELRLRNDRRIADFILRRDGATPAMLIELESPSSPPFKKNGELTAAANHAREQIVEWVQFIYEDPANTVGEMDFLRIPNRQRLIIMGRGLEHEDRMRRSRYSDTVVWTYDFLIHDTRERWRHDIAQQCKLLGLPWKECI